MGLASENYYNGFYEESMVSDTYLDLWNDIFEYANNLSGNWMISQEIFRKKIVPTAEQNPMKFAKWVDDMVKVSGLKIKSRNMFARSLRFIRRFKNLKNVSRNELSKAVTEILNSGISDPTYAKRAMNKVKA